MQRVFDSFYGHKSHGQSLSNLLRGITKKPSDELSSQFFGDESVSSHASKFTQETATQSETFSVESCGSIISDGKSSLSLTKHLATGNKPFDDSTGSQSVSCRSEARSATTHKKRSRRKKKENDEASFSYPGELEKNEKSAPVEFCVQRPVDPSESKVVTTVSPFTDQLEDLIRLGQQIANETSEQSSAPSSPRRHKEKERHRHRSQKKSSRKSKGSKHGSSRRSSRGATEDSTRSRNTTSSRHTFATMETSSRTRSSRTRSPRKPRSSTPSEIDFGNIDNFRENSRSNGSILHKDFPAQLPFEDEFIFPECTDRQKQKAIELSDSAGLAASWNCEDANTSSFVSDEASSNDDDGEMFVLEAPEQHITIERSLAMNDLEKRQRRERIARSRGKSPIRQVTRRPSLTMSPASSTRKSVFNRSCSFA